MHHAGTFTMVGCMLALAPKQQKWVWVLTDFRVRKPSASCCCMHFAVFDKCLHHFFASPGGPDKNLLHSWIAACHTQQHMPKASRRRE